MLERGAALYRDRLAVAVVGDTALTYGELRGRVRRFASGLARLGVGPGDRVAIMARNGLPFFDVYLAVAYLGAIAVPINVRLADPEVSAILADAEPVVAIGDDDLFVSLSKHFDGEHVVRVGDRVYGELLAAPDEVDVDASDEEDVVLIMYTSGTTGAPKGICLSQRAITFNAISLALVQEIVTDEVFLSVLPLYHAAAGTRVMTMLLDGPTHVVMRDFDVERCIRAIEEYRVTSTIFVPVQLRRFLDAVSNGGADLRSLRLLTYGAAVTDPALIERAYRELPCGLFQGYGLTEATTNLTALLPADHERALRDEPELLTSCGRPAPGVQIELRDDEARQAPLGEVGEIYARSMKLMSRYWRDPQATTEALADGWLRTGDLARQDADGYLYLVGRRGDMLISGGVNVYPSEIEAVLHKHPDVREAAVVGVAHDEWGEVPVAFVILRPGVEFDDGAMVEYCRARLARYKVPTRFYVVEDFARTATGKVRKVELRERVAAK